jgi:copper transport protein
MPRAGARAAGASRHGLPLGAWARVAAEAATPKEGWILLLRRVAMLGLVSLAVAVTLALAPAASAHSTLLETEPPRDQVVEQSPKEVVLHFDEPVETALGSITVYDGEGESVDVGEIMRPTPESVAVAIEGELERGTYTVTWRVISEDSDPIDGVWVFHVQEPGAQPEGVAAQVLEDTPFVVSAFYVGGRFLDFALLLFCVGGTAALAIALRHASDRVRRRLLGILAAAAAGLTVIALIGLGLQGAAAGGAGLGEGFRWDSITSVADTRFGHFSLLRAGLAAALCAVALVARAKISPPPAGAMTRMAGRHSDGEAGASAVGVGTPAREAGGRGLAVAQRARAAERANAAQRWRRASDGRPPPSEAGDEGSEGGRPVSATTVAALLLALGLIVTPGLSGHASVSGPVSIVADAAHVLAAAVWTGGLAFVVLALFLTRTGRWRLAASSVPRFSTMAVVAVTVLIVAGVINGYLQVREWRGLWDTEYGVLLLIKIGLVLPLLAIGAYNNRFAVPRLRAQLASMVERRRFLRLAGAELAIMLAIVGVTAGLVNAPPARTEVQMHEASEMDLELGPLMAHMEVKPGTLGPNEIHLEFTKGRPNEVRVSAELKSKNIGPLRYRARRGMEPGTYVVRRANLSPAGEWEIRVDARRGKLDLYSATVNVPIEKEP